MAPANIRLNPIGALICVAVGFCIVIYIFGFPDWFRSEPRISMKELLSVSIELAKRGGQRVYEVKTQNKDLQGQVKGKTAEGANELLTRGDMESHRAMIYGFAKAFPGLKVISEEHEVKPVDLNTIPDVNKHNPDVEKLILSDQSIAFKDITVWIDPLDATQEYSEDLRQYVTTMVCVAVNGAATIGVIHKPFENVDQTSWAWVGYGMSKNLQDLKDKNDKAEKTDATKVHKIIVSRSHSGAVEKVAKTAFGENTKVIPAGGAGFKTLEVVKRNADAYTHVTAIKKWDICAGNAILSAMDGKMTTLEGNYITYSPRENVKNEHGLLATVNDHFDLYLKKLASAVEEVKKEKESKQQTQSNKATGS